jgi:hypothetical protein
MGQTLNVNDAISAYQPCSHGTHVHEGTVYITLLDMLLLDPEIEITTGGGQYLSRISVHGTSSFQANLRLHSGSLVTSHEDLAHSTDSTPNSLSIVTCSSRLAVGSGSGHRVGGMM